MITDTQQFIAAMAARGELRFAAPVAVAKVSRQVRAEVERERAGQKRRATGCRVYAQPFKGRLPARSDPRYTAVYNRLAREAEGSPAYRKHPEMNGLARKERNKLWMRKWRKERKLKNL